MKKQQKDYVFVTILLWLGVVAVSVPFLRAARYALFKSDDFSFYLDIINTRVIIC